jgi:hypothetical protein
MVPGDTYFAHDGRTQEEVSWTRAKAVPPAPDWRRQNVIGGSVNTGGKEGSGATALREYSALPLPTVPRINGPNGPWTE